MASTPYKDTPNHREMQRYLRNRLSEKDPKKDLDVEETKRIKDKIQMYLAGQGNPNLRVDGVLLIDFLVTKLKFTDFETFERWMNDDSFDLDLESPELEETMSFFVDELERRVALTNEMAEFLNRLSLRRDPKFSSDIGDTLNKFVLVKDFLERGADPDIRINGVMFGDFLIRNLGFTITEIFQLYDSFRNIPFQIFESAEIMDEVRGQMEEMKAEMDTLNTKGVFNLKDKELQKLIRLKEFFVGPSAVLPLKLHQYINKIKAGKAKIDQKEFEKFVFMHGGVNPGEIKVRVGEEEVPLIDFLILNQNSRDYDLIHYLQKHGAVINAPRAKEIFDALSKEIHETRKKLAETKRSQMDKYIRETLDKKGRLELTQIKNIMGEQIWFFKGYRDPVNRDTIFEITILHAKKEDAPFLFELFKEYLYSGFSSPESEQTFMKIIVERWDELNLALQSGKQITPEERTFYDSIKKSTFYQNYFDGWKEKVEKEMRVEQKPKEPIVFSRPEVARAQQPSASQPAPEKPKGPEKRPPRPPYRSTG